jgi:hypothetical protein
VGQDSSVGIATHYKPDRPGIEPWCGPDFPHPSRPALGPTQLRVQWMPGHDFDHTRPPSAEVKEIVMLYLADLMVCCRVHFPFYWCSLWHHYISQFTIYSISNQLCEAGPFLKHLAVTQPQKRIPRRLWNAKVLHLLHNSLPPVGIQTSYTELQEFNTHPHTPFKIHFNPLKTKHICFI